MISLAFSHTVAAEAGWQSKADSVTVRNATYSPRPILPCGFSPMWGDGHLCFKNITSLCCTESRKQHPAKAGCCFVDRRRAEKNDAHQKWRPPAAVFGLLIVLSILSLTYGNFAFNSKTLPIFSQFSFKTLSYIQREKTVQCFHGILRRKSPKDRT